MTKSKYARAELRLPRDIKKTVNKFATDNGMSFNAVVLVALRDYLKKNGLLK